MPSVYTHHIVARETLKRLPEQLQDKIKPHLSLYFFGAHGADFCFFYKFLQPRMQNIGSFLHRTGGYDAFCVLKAFAAHDERALAYAFGYITHYAADVAFHPFVYKAAGKSLLTHSRVENAIDALLYGSYFKNNREGYERYFRKKLTSDEENEVFLLYAAIAAKVGFPPLLRRPFSRAIRVFNAYLPLSFSVFGKSEPSVLQTAFGQEPARRCLNVFHSTVGRAETLVQRFYEALESGKPLSRALFAKNYLTGK